MFHSCEVISHKDPAGFAIDAFVVASARQIIRPYTCKAEVNRQSLIRLRCNAGSVWTCGSLSLLRLNTCGALIKDCGLAFKLGNTCDVFVSIVEVFIARVS